MNVEVKFSKIGENYMTPVNVNVELDGENNGIAVQFTTSNNKRKFLGWKDSKIRLFTNLELAKVIANTLVDVSEIRYFMVIGDEKFSFNECQKTGDIYRVYSGDVQYIIKEKKEGKGIKFGYFVFEDGDTVRCDKKYGYTRQKELLKIIRYLASCILYSNDPVYNINRITKKKNEYVFHVRNSTAKIHVLNNSKLMDLNQQRKSQDQRVLPFIREMDKFTTLYVYITKDIIEPIRINSDEIANTIVDYMIQDLSDLYKELNPKFVEVEYTGYINIMED